MSDYIKYLCKIEKFSEKSYYANDAQMFYDYIHGTIDVNEMTNVRFNKESTETPLSYYNNEAQQFYDYANTLTSELEIKDCPSVEPDPDPEPDPHPGPEPDPEPDPVVPEPEESDIEKCEIKDHVCEIKFKKNIEAIDFYKPKGEDEDEETINVNHQVSGKKNYKLLMYNEENPFENIEIDRIVYKINASELKEYKYNKCQDLGNTEIEFIDCGIDNTFIHFNFKKIENPDNFYVRFYSQNDEIIYQSSKLNNIDNNSEKTILKLEKNIEIRNDKIVKFEILIIDHDKYKLVTNKLDNTKCIETLNTLSNKVTEAEILKKLQNISFKYFKQNYSESKLLDELSEVTCEVFLDKDLIICLKNQDEEERLNKPELYDLVFKHSYYFSLKLLTNNSQDESLVSFNNGKNDKIITSFSELKISKNTIKKPSTNITLTLQICKRKAEEEEILHTIEEIPKLFFTTNPLDRIDEGHETDTDTDTDTDTESEEEPGPQPGPAVISENITVEKFEQEDIVGNIETENGKYKLKNKNEVNIKLKSIPQIENFNEYSISVSGGQGENPELNKSNGLITLNNNLIQTKTKEFTIVVSKRISEDDSEEKLRIVILPADIISKKISIKTFKQGDREIPPIEETTKYQLENTTDAVSIELNTGELGDLIYHLNGEKKNIVSKTINIDSSIIENPPNDLSIVIESSRPEIDNLEITIIPFRTPGPARPPSPVREGPGLSEGNRNNSISENTISVDTFKQTTEDGNTDIEIKDDKYQLENKNQVTIQLKSEINNFSNLKIIDGIGKDISQGRFTEDSGLITLNEAFIQEKSSPFSIFVMENAEHPVEKLRIVIIPHGNTIQKIEVEEFKQGTKSISPISETNTYQLSNTDEAVEIKLKPEGLSGLKYSLGGEVKSDIQNNIIKLKSEFIKEQIAEFKINIQDEHGNTLEITIIPKRSSIEPQRPGPGPGPEPLPPGPRPPSSPRGQQQKIKIISFMQDDSEIQPIIRQNKKNLYKLRTQNDITIKLRPEELINYQVFINEVMVESINVSSNNIIILRSSEIEKYTERFDVRFTQSDCRDLLIKIEPAKEEYIDPFLIDMNEEEEKVKLDGYDDEEFKIYCHDDIIKVYFEIFIENLQYYYTDMIYERDVMKNYYDIMNYLICLFKYLMNSENMDINFDTGDEPLTKLFQSERNILDQSCNDTKFKAEPVKDILKIDLIDNLRMGINSLLVNTYQKDMRFLFQDLFYFFIKKNSPNSPELINVEEDKTIFKINLEKLTIKLIHDYFYSDISDDYLLQNNNTVLDDNTELDDIDKSYEDVIQKIKECQVLKIIHLFEDYKEELKSQKDKVIEKLQGKEDVFSYFGFFD